MAEKYGVKIKLLAPTKDEFKVEIKKLDNVGTVKINIDFGDAKKQINEFKKSIIELGSLCSNIKIGKLQENNEKNSSNGTQRLVADLSKYKKLLSQYNAIENTFIANSNNKQLISVSKSSSINTYREQVKLLSTMNVKSKEFKTTLSSVSAKSEQLYAALKKLSSRNTGDKRLNSEARELNNIYTRINETLRINKRLSDSSVGKGMQDLAKSIDLKEIDSNSAQKRLAELQKEASNLGLTADTVGVKLKKLFNEHFKTAIAMASIHVLQSALNQLVTNILDLDAALVNIRIVTGQNNVQAGQLLSTYNSMAKALGSTTAQVSEAATDWLRQGYSLQDTNTLIQNSMVLSKVGMVDSADATTYLTSAMKGYNVSVEKSIDVVDKLAKVDMAAAVSAGGIAEGMSRTASSAQLAGISMDKLIGYLTTVGEVTQKDMSSIGESFKTLFARMGNIKSGHLIDPETDESLSDVESTLSGLGIKLRDSETEFRNFGDVIDDVGNNWSNYSSVQQHAIAVAFAGVRNQENFLVLMQNYKKALGYSEVAANSAGTAMEKFNVYTEGFEAKINAFKAAYEGLSNTFVNSDIFKTAIDSGTKVITLLDKLIGTLKTIPVIIATISAAMTLSGKQAGILTFFGTKKDLDGAIQSFTLLGKSIDVIKKQWTTTSGSLNKMKGFFTPQSVIDAQNTLDKDAIALEKFYKIMNGHSTITKKAENALEGASSACRNFAKENITAANGVELFKQKQKQATSITSGFINGIKGITASLASMGLTLAVSYLVNIAIENFVKLINANKIAIEEAAKLTDEYNSAAKEIKDTSSTLEGLRNEFSTLSKGIDENGKNIGLTADEYSRYKDIVNQVLDISPSLIKGYNDEGDALVNNNTLISDAIKLQKELNEEKLKGYLDSGEEKLKGNRAEIKEAKKEIGVGTGSLGRKFINSFTDPRTHGTVNVSSAVINQYKNLGIDLQKINTGNIEELQKLSSMQDVVLNQLQTEYGIGEDKIQQAKAQIGLIDIQLKRIQSANSNTAQFLALWASSEGQDWYGNIETGYLDEFQAELSKIASDDSLSIYEIEAKTKALGEAFLKVQDQIPTENIKSLNEQYRDGLLSEEEYNQKLNEQIDIIDAVANSLRETSPEIASLFNAIASGYRDFASTANSDELVSVDFSEYDNQIAKIDELAKGFEILQNAQAQYNNLGYLTADMWSSLSDSNLVGYLDFSTGALQINTQAFQNNVNAAKIAALAKLQDAAAADINALALGNITQMSPLAQSAIGYFGANAELVGNQALDSASKINAMANALANVAAGAEGKTKNVGQFKTQVDLVINAYKGAAKSLFSMQPASSGYQNAMGGNTASTNGAKSATDDYTDSLNKEKEALEDVKAELEDQKDVYNSVLRAVKKRYEDEIKLIEKQKDALEDKQNNYDSVIDAVTSKLDEEIQKLEDEKEALENKDIEGSLGWQIKAIQDKIDALDEANDAQEKQLELEKAEAEFQRAQSQRTLRVYRAGIGFVWEADQSAIQEAKDNLDKVKLEKEMSDLENAKKELEKALEGQQEIIDKQIDKLEEYKNKWSEVADSYKQDQNKFIADQILGSNWEKSILAGRMDVFNNFKNNYFSVMDAIAEKSKEIEALERMKDEWDSVSDAYEEQRDRLNAAMILGENWEKDILNGRVETLINFKNKYIEIMEEISAKAEEIEALEKRIKESQKNISSSGGSGSGTNSSGGGSSNSGQSSKQGRFKVTYNGTSIGDYATMDEAAARVREYKSLIERNPNPNIKYNPSAMKITPYAKGTLSSKAGIANLDELGEELIVRPLQGRYSMLQKGTGVIPAEPTKTLWDFGLNPKEFLKNKMSDILQLSAINMNLKSPNTTQYNVDIGGIEMHEVNDVDTFGSTLAKTLKTAIPQIFHS